MAVTLQQIAEAAGVSRGTVDRALNNRGRIRPEIEEKIKNIAQEMGYQPSRAGRALAMASRKVRIGVILQCAEMPFMQQIRKGVMKGREEVESFGGTVRIYEIEGTDPAKVMNAMEELREAGFYGIALTPSEDQLLKSRIDQYSGEYGIPVVTFCSDLKDTKRICFAGQDNYRSGCTAAGLMAEMTGDRGKIVIISGQASNPVLNDRQKGFENEIKESFPKLQIVDIRYSYDDDWVASKIMEELLELYPDLTGVYIAGHGVKGVCSTLKKQGKDRSLHVIANDFTEENLECLKEGSVNFLIGQDAMLQGHLPVKILFQLLFDNEQPRKEVQYTDIVIRTKYNMRD